MGHVEEIVQQYGVISMFTKCTEENFKACEAYISSAIDDLLDNYQYAYGSRLKEFKSVIEQRDLGISSYLRVGCVVHEVARKYLTYLMDNLCNMLARAPVAANCGVFSQDNVIYIDIEDLSVFFFLNLDRESEFSKRSRLEVCIIGRRGASAYQERYASHRGVIYVFQFCIDIANDDRWILFKIDKIKSNRENVAEEECREVAEICGFMGIKNKLGQQDIYSKVIECLDDCKSGLKYQQIVDLGVAKSYVIDIADTFVTRTWSLDFKIAVLSVLRHPKVRHEGTNEGNEVFSEETKTFFGTNIQYTESKAFGVDDGVLVVSQLDTDGTMS